MKGPLARLLVLAVAIATTVSSQPATRRATNIAALTIYPSFYHLRPILLVGKVERQPNGQLRVSDSAGSLRIVTEDSVPEGVDEVRGEFWDIGRLKPDDPRLAAYDLRRTFHVDPDGAWPRPGEVTAIIASAIVPAQPVSTPSIRTIVLDPSRYLDQKVTIAGQYEGRNLMGDLPAAPARSRWDFVLRSADAAIWVINIQPKGKDAGKDWQLGLDARIDTGRWLQVSGMVRQGRGLLWIDAEAKSLSSLVKAPTAPAAEEPEAPIRVPAAPPPEVVFSAPTEDESDVSLTTNVRIQFSRDLDPGTLRARVRVSYLESQTIERGEPTTPTAEFTTQYRAANRVLELRFASPLERFRTVKVQLLEGILGTDKQPLKAWTLTFATGGS
jgi:hypothetical protein